MKAIEILEGVNFSHNYIKDIFSFNPLRWCQNSPPTIGIDGKIKFSKKLKTKLISLQNEPSQRNQETAQDNPQGQSNADSSADFKRGKRMAE